MVSKKGMSTIVVSIAVITVFATLVAIIMGNRIEGLMTIFNNGADIGTGDVEENNMYNLIKEFLSQGLYQDAKDLSDEFMSKFKESDMLDEVKYLKFYALSNYDMELAFSYVIEVVSSNETAVDNMLKRDYALDGASSTAETALKRAEEVTWNFYEGIKYLIADEEGNAKASFEKNFKYTQVHSQVYLNFPTFDLYTYRSDNGDLYPYRIKKVSKISVVAYAKVSSCEDMSGLTDNYADWLESYTVYIPEYVTPEDTENFVSGSIASSSTRAEYLEVKEICSSIKDSLCTSYKNKVEVELKMYINEEQRIEMIDRLKERMKTFDQEVHDSCEVDYDAAKAGSGAAAP